MALRAATENSVANGLAGIICLSTPFLAASVRPWVKKEPGATVDWCMRMISGAFPLFAGIAVVGRAFLIPGDRPGLTSSLVGIGGIGIFIGLVMICSHSLRRRLWHLLYCGADSYVRHLEMPPLSKKLLVVRAVADEASSVLTVAYFLGWAVGLFDIVSGIVLFPGLAAGSVVGVVSSFLHRPTTMANEIVAGTLIVVLGGVLLAYVARVPLALSFGVRISPLAPLLAISVEAAPRGESEIMQLAPLEARLGGLSHSWTHESPTVAARVSLWMSDPEPSGREAI